jgi:LmbE family N-acetylglucosaminyl deacetylase
MNVLFVFAHQDDEIAMATRITYALRRGARVTCVYLTNGEGGRATSAVRDAESRTVLTRLGVDLKRAHFIGSEARIPDGRLHEHLDRALALVDDRIIEMVDEVYCLAYEGGHHDHDASHLVATAFAMRRGIIERTYEMPLYHGYGLPGPFFNTLAPIKIGAPWAGRIIALREAFSLVLLCRFYRSQRKTWLGLLPEALLRMALGRREWTRAVDITRLHARPHEGKLFYERRFRMPWETFEAATRDFIARALR